jgi:hypothetical protein
VAGHAAWVAGNGGGKCKCGARWTGASRCHSSETHETYSCITAFDHAIKHGAKGLELRDGIWSWQATKRFVRRAA